MNENLKLSKQDTDELFRMFCNLCLYEAKEGTETAYVDTGMFADDVREERFELNVNDIKAVLESWRQKGLIKSQTETGKTLWTLTAKGKKTEIYIQEREERELGTVLCEEGNDEYIQLEQRRKLWL